MNLAEAMLNKMHEAGLEASRDQNLMPPGLSPMSPKQGGDVLAHLRQPHQHATSRSPIRTMNADHGALIQQKLMGVSNEEEPITEAPPIKAVIGRFLGNFLR